MTHIHPAQTPARLCALSVFLVALIGCASPTSQRPLPSPSSTPAPPQDREEGQPIPLPERLTALQELELAFKTVPDTESPLPQHSDVHELMQSAGRLAKQCSKRNDALSKNWASCVCTALCNTPYPPRPGKGSVSVQIPFLDVDGLAWHIAPSGRVQRCSYANIQREIEEFQIHCGTLP